MIRAAPVVPRDRRPPPPARFAAFGPRSWIVPPTRVVGPERIRIGADVVVLEHALLNAAGPPGDSEGIRPVLRLGDRVHLGRFSVVVATVGVDVGDDVWASDGVSIIDTWGPGGDAPGPDALGSRIAPPPPRAVVIGPGAYLAAAAVLTPGVRVGAGAYVGEGAVVVRDVAPHTVVYGNPAAVVRRFDAEDRGWRDEPEP